MTAEIAFNLGVVLSMASRIPEAMRWYGQAIEIKPDYAEAHNNLAILYHATGRLTEALAAYRRALATRRDYTEARYNLGLLYQQQGRLEEAAETYRQVIARQPRHAEAHNNLGNVRLALNLPDAARKSYLRSLAFDGAQAQPRWNLGVTELLLGNFKDGWRGYEWRFRQTVSTNRHQNIPLWEGNRLNGRRLLVWAEQGLGDTIQMVRFLRRFKEMDGSVFLECQRPLIPLFHSLEGITEMVPMGDSLPPVDCQIPLMSLPGKFGVQLSDLPGAVSYLRVDEARVEAWRQRLARFPLPRIGIAWAGSRKHANDQNRSIAPEWMSPLLAVDGAFFSLQPDAEAVKGVHSFAADLTDFSETAALMKNLDLVISVDTSVAHLAGALHRPVWILLPHAPDWRWLMNRADSPWYPSAQLFRQPQRGDWESAIREVVLLLNQRNR